MPSFMVRVELHHASTREDYEKLHAAMQEAEFYSIIKGSDGNWYKLPTAEYETEAYTTCEQAREAADTAAATTGKTRAILVTQSAGTVWRGLENLGP